MYPDMHVKISVPNFGDASRQNFKAEKLRFQFRDIATLSQCLCNAARHRQSENGVVNYNVSLKIVTMHKRRKIGPELGSTQRAAITPGFATHSGLILNRTRST